MRPLLVHSGLAVALVFLLTPALSAQPTEQAPEQIKTDGVRLATRVLNQRATIEILDMAREQADPIARKAFAEMVSFERQLTADLERLNADDSGDRRLTVDPQVAELLARGVLFCNWNRATHGPLGGRIYDHWASANPPSLGALTTAAESARCDRLIVDTRTNEVVVAGSSRVDLRGFREGFLVDLAVESLRRQGVTNALIGLGRVRRGIGGGVDGKGWQILLPAFEGLTQPLDELRLNDAAIAIAWQSDANGDRPLLVDQRTGQPAKGVWATVTVTELAVDAQGVASTAFVLGSREGEFRIGGLKPKPSVLWLLGEGSGQPLITDYNWSALRIR